MAHLVKLIQSRTLHLQRVVSANPYEINEKDSGAIKDLAQRLADIEARDSIAGSSSNSTNEMSLNSKQTAVLTTEVRRNLQPDLDGTYS